MGKTKDIILTPEQRSELDKGYRFGACHRFRMRCRGVLLKADGMRVQDIVPIVGYGKLAIYKWLARYEEAGLDGLREKGGRGPKPLMGSADTEAVRDAVKKHRESVKTAKAEWQAASNKEVSESTFRRFLDLLAQDISV